MKIKNLIDKRKYNFEDRKAFLFSYGMLALPFLFFILFWVYINASSFVLAFQDAQGNFTWDNFKTVFEGFRNVDMYGWNLTDMVGRTLFLWFLLYVACVIPGMLSSYILFKKIPGHYVFRVIFMIPTVLTGIVWVSIMKYLVSVDGPILALADIFGWETSLDVQWNGLLGSPETAYATIVWMNVIPHLVGFNMIITGAYARIPDHLFEVGRLEGLGFFSEFFRVAVPLVWQTVVVCMISNFAVMFTVEGNVFLYTRGAYETGTVGFYLYYLQWQLAGSASTMNAFYGYPAAIGMVFTVVTVPVVLFGKMVLERAIPPVEY